jgi:hypothetical protein
MPYSFVIKAIASSNLEREWIRKDSLINIRVDPKYFMCKVGRPLVDLYQLQGYSYQHSAMIMLKPELCRLDVCRKKVSKNSKKKIDSIS